VSSLWSTLQSLHKSLERADDMKKHSWSWVDRYRALVTDKTDVCMFVCFYYICTMYVCRYVPCMSVCMSICMSVCLYVCMYVC
jgi:hypothetical protein